VNIKTNRIVLLTLTFLLGSIVAFAQGPNVNGTYEGMVKIPNGPEQKLSLELPACACPRPFECMTRAAERIVGEYDCARPTVEPALVRREL